MFPDAIDFLYDQLERCSSDVDYDHKMFKSFRPLFEEDFHIRFEQADLDNDIAFFNTHYSNHSKFFDMWVFATDGIFAFTNYKRFRRTMMDGSDRKTPMTIDEYGPMCSSCGWCAEYPDSHIDHGSIAGCKYIGNISENEQ